MGVDRQKKFWDSMAGNDPDAGVIDPNDILGYKNSYVCQLRNFYFINSLKHQACNGPILDFGCGTGLVGDFLGERGYQVVGADIAPKLLSHGKKVRPSMNLVQFDGENLPFKDACFSAIVVYVVFNYIEDDQELVKLLSELHRVLKPNGKLIAIEQTSHRRTTIDSEHKTLRRKEEYLNIIEEAKFTIETCKTVRFGKFPFIYLIRFGLVPSRLTPIVRKLEAFFGGLLKAPRFTYVDSFIVAKKTQFD
jgi:SAM-dependent methyltransferase